MRSAAREYWPDALAMAGLLPFIWLGLGNLPFGDHPNTVLIDGADAGEWILNAQLVFSGDWSEVDTHRGPTFLLTAALARFLFDDMVRAARFVLVSAWAVRPFLLYALGRLHGGPLVGWLAALGGICCTPLYFAAARVSIDPFLSTMLLLSLLAVAPARRYPAWAWVAGMVGAATMTTHLSALPYSIPALCLLMLQPDTSTRRPSVLVRPLLYVSGLVATLFVLSQAFDLLTIQEITGSVSEGIAARTEPVAHNAQLSPDALQKLQAGSGNALSRAAVALTTPLFESLGRPGVLVAMLALGALGPGLRAPASGPPCWLRGSLGRRPDARWKRWMAEQHLIARAVTGFRWLRLDVLTGLVLLSTLAPALFFASADSPERYTDNLLPLAVLLAARGVGAVVGTLSRLLPGSAGPYGAAAVALAIAVGVVPSSWAHLSTIRQGVPIPGDVARAIAPLAKIIDQTVPGDSAVAVPLREAAALLERRYCPRVGFVPDDKPALFERSVRHLRAQCSGTGPIPYVWFEQGPLGMGDDVFSQAFGKWAADTYGVAGRLDHAVLKASIIRIPRSEAP